MWRNSISYLIHVPQWNITTLISLLIIRVHLQRTKEAPGVDKKVIPEFASIKMCTMAFFQMDFIFIPFLCWMLMSVRRHPEKERKNESKRYLSAVDGIRCRSKNELFRWHRTQFAIKSEISWIFSYLFRPENSRLIVSKINKKKILWKLWEMLVAHFGCIRTCFTIGIVLILCHKWTENEWQSNE